ncbi:MAG: hypothetical protein K1X57_10820 [Gemmataceae bacterium]|nr:hypothetical protein [Gemmataceae bacterium]
MSNRKMLPTSLAAIMTGLALWSAPAEARADDPPVARTEDDKKPVDKWQAAWADLVGKDDVKATRAVLTLALSPREAVPFLTGKLRVVSVDDKKVKKWIDDVASEKAEVRDAAAKELDFIAPLIQEELMKAIENAADDDTRDRLMKIMHDLPDDIPGAVGGIAIAVPALPAGGGALPIPVPPAPPGGGAIIVGAANAIPLGEDAFVRTSWRQSLRAIAILEHIGTPEAVATLKKLSEGHADAKPTKAAKEALDRLNAGKK